MQRQRNYWENMDTQPCRKFLDGDLSVIQLCSTNVFDITKFAGIGHETNSCSKSRFYRSVKCAQSKGKYF